jgi:low temperature requirement protein LtrA
VLGFVVVACLWWVYFDIGVEVAVPPSPGGMLVFAYAHVPLIAALTAVGAGVHLFIEEARHDHVVAGAAWALDGGAALYLICLGVAQHETLGRIRPAVKLARYGVAAALLLAAAFASALSPVVLVLVSAALLAGLAAYETSRALSDQDSSPAGASGWPSSAETASSPSRTA